MTLEEAIYKRKSCRSFQKKDLEKEDVDKIQYYMDHQMHCLFPNIKIKLQIEDKKNIKCIVPWVTNQVITFYSEAKDGYGMNAGFILQHLELYLHTIGISSCYLGMAKPIQKQRDSLEYIICMSIGYAQKEEFRELHEFKRKEWSQFSDKMDEKLEGARFAPSSVNSQPWYFTHDKNTIHLWYVPQKGAFKSIKLKPNLLNQIDLGIVVAHVCICNEGIRLFKTKQMKHQNYVYIMSFKLD